MPVFQQPASREELIQKLLSTEWELKPSMRFFVLKDYLSKEAYDFCRELILCRMLHMATMHNTVQETIDILKELVLKYADLPVALNIIKSINIYYWRDYYYQHKGVVPKNWQSDFSRQVLASRPNSFVARRLQQDLEERGQK